MHYYRDRLTRSIYSARELVEMTRARQISPRELLVRFEELHEHERVLLEETERRAARARGGRQPGRWRGGPASWLRAHLPGL